MDSEFSNEKIGIEKLNEEVEQYKWQEDELRGNLGAVDPELLDEYTQAVQQRVALQVLAELMFLDSDDEIAIRFLFGLPVNEDLLSVSLVNWPQWKLDRLK
jgi:hypothetical protein